MDLQRLLDYRSKALHAIGAANSATLQAETTAVITRLRLAFEPIRRTLLPLDLEWIPYLERIESLCDQVLRILDSGRKVVLVSSGAIGAGIGLLNLKQRPKDLPHLQAAARINPPVPPSDSQRRVRF